jgi:hypothetical protein
MVSAEAEGPMGWMPAPSVDNSRAAQALLIVLSVTAGCTDIIGFLVLCVAAGPRIDPSATNAILAGLLGVSAMAVQNALVQISLKGAPSMAVMTSNVTRFAMDVGEAIRPMWPRRATERRVLCQCLSASPSAAASVRHARPHLAHGSWLCLPASPCSRLRWVLRPSPTVNRTDESELLFSVTAYDTASADSPGHPPQSQGLGLISAAARKRFRKTTNSFSLISPEAIANSVWRVRPLPET